jgi:hypothetical protein
MAIRNTMDVSGPGAKQEVLVIFVLKVPARKHNAFQDWATRFGKYKDKFGIVSEHYVTCPLPEGVFTDWRGLESAVGTAVEDETWIVIERFRSKEMRTDYLNLENDPERVTLFAELKTLTSSGQQIMNEYFPDNWKGFRD